MAAMSSAGAGPKAGGSSPLATSGPSVTPSSSPSAQGQSAAFPKSARLLKRPEFRRVYDQGRRVTSPSFAMFFAPRSATSSDSIPAGAATGPRIGLTAPRALGKSVARNRIKRRMREAIRLELAPYRAPIDYVFHPRRSVLDVAFPQLRREVVRILRQCEAGAR